MTDSAMVSLITWRPELGKFDVQETRIHPALGLSRTLFVIGVCLAVPGPFHLNDLWIQAQSERRRQYVYVGMARARTKH